MKNFTLYGLRKPGEEARYIGIASTALHKRLSSHLSKRTDDYRGRWIAKAKRDSSVIEIVPYCVGLSEKDACELERQVIAELRKLGLDLVNTHEGGNLPPSSLGRKRSSQTKAKMTGNKNASGNKNALGMKHTPEWKAAHSARMTGKKYALGSNRSPEQKAKKSVQMVGKNLGNKNALGYKHTPEQCEKRRGNKNGSGSLGIKRTQETKDRMVVAQKLQHEKKRQESYLAEMWR